MAPPPGVVAAGTAEVADAGAAILRAGGNAVDAAVAAMFTAAFAEPTLTSAGGAGIALVHAPARAVAETFDFFAAVPGLPAQRLDPRGIEFVDLEIDFGSGTTQHFHVGRGATAVPGCLAGLLELHRRHGRMALPRVLEEPERLARHGVRLSAHQARFVELLRPIVHFSEDLPRVFGVRDGRARPGHLLTNAAWADTLAWIRAHGEDPLTGGFLREPLLARFGPPAGLLTAEDLDRYATAVGNTHFLSYRGHRVLLPGFPSLGGAMVGLALQLLDGVDLPADPFGPERLLVLAAVQEATLRARKEMGALAPGETLAHWLAPERVDRHRAIFQELLGRTASTGDGEGPLGPILGNTTQVSVVDGDGLAATITTSNGESCGVTLPPLGLALNNFLGEEDINPLGWHQEPPGARMRTMMCPTVVQARDGRHIALGTGGSKRIPGAITQVLVNLLDYGLDPAAAVRLPRIHRELDGCFLEAAGLDAATVAAVRARYPGVRTFPELDVYFGGVHVASRGPGSTLAGAGDSRRGGALSVAARPGG